MKIIEWSLQNFSSFGNIEQTIKLNQENGELILLYGTNGSGKTGTLKSIDFSLFGEILNKRGKRMSQKLIPNRLNGNCKTSIKYISDNGEEIEIVRNLSGSLKTTLTIDGQPYNKAGKVQDRIEESIGYDIDTFKAFISLDLNIFKDYINLTPDDKRTILDKLFNLQIINDLNKILKQLRSQNDSEFSTINSQIRLYEDQIESLKASIEDASNIIKENNTSKLSELKDKMNSNKSKYIELESNRDDLEKKLEEHDGIYKQLSDKLLDINRDEKEIQKQIDLYDSGKCPTCGSDLSVKLDIKSSLSERLSKTLDIKSEIAVLLEKARIDKIESKEALKLADIEFNTMTEMLSSLKREMNSIKEKIESDKNDSVELDTINSNLRSLEDKYSKKQSEFVESQKMKFVYDTLLPIWGETGIKRDIIDSIIDPINQCIKEDMSIIGSKYDIEIDNNFDVVMTEWGVEIDPDTLSTGEGKRVNLIIMLAYLKIMSMKRGTNLLILDELFAGIDLDGVDYVLKLLKKYANDSNVNIVIVHHSEMNKSMFDRILKVNKIQYSFIEDEKID